MFDAFLRWINVEKAVFSVSALWLVAFGMAYQDSPGTKSWGPARVPDSPPEYRPVNLETPPPIEEFLASARGSPFADVERKRVFNPSKLPIWNPRVRRHVTKPKPRRPTEPPKVPIPPPDPRKVDADLRNGPDGEGPKAYDLPVRLAGRVEVGGAGGRTVFIVKEDGQYISVKEGDELPGLGVRVVLSTKNIVIVENEKGQRFRLTDLLREKKEEEEEGGGE